MKSPVLFLVTALLTLWSFSALAKDPDGSPPLSKNLVTQIQTALLDVAGPNVPSGEIDLDAQAVRYLLQPIADQMGASFDLFLNEVQFVKLKNQGKYSDLTVELNRETTIQITDEEQAKDYQLYAVRFPRKSRFKLRAIDGKFVLVPSTKLVFSVKIPAISDHVYLRKITIDIATGNSEIRVGIIGNTVEIAATAELYKQQFDGINYGKSILDNMALWLGAPVLLGILF